MNDDEPTTTAADTSLDAPLSPDMMRMMASALRVNNALLGKAVGKAIAEYDATVGERVKARIAESTAGIEGAFATLVARLESRIARLESERDHHE